MSRLNNILGSINDLGDSDISRLFFCARSSPTKTLKGAVLMTAFFEPSTRTRLSFEVAAARLSMGITTFHKDTSSQLKGEVYEDTIRNLLALRPDVLVVRSSSRFMPEYYLSSAVVINGGDGINEHPTQALTDCFTLLNYWQVDDLHAKKILIVGDIAHSRVAHSNIRLMSRLGAEVYLLAPKTFAMKENWGQCLEFSSWDDIRCPMDAVMSLRVQKERIDQGLLMSDQAYYAHYGLTKERLESLGNACVVLHPGPMNVGIEIEQAVASHERSLILSQVSNGVLVRASLLALCL